MEIDFLILHNIARIMDISYYAKWGNEAIANSYLATSPHCQNLFTFFTFSYKLFFPMDTHSSICSLFLTLMFSDLCLSSYLLSILDFSPLTPSLMAIRHEKRIADLFRDIRQLAKQSDNPRQVE